MTMIDINYERPDGGSLKEDMKKLNDMAFKVEVLKSLEKTIEGLSSSSFPPSSFWELKTRLEGIKTDLYTDKIDCSKATELAKIAFDDNTEKYRSKQ